jgi:hypothetical protein
VNEVCVPGLIGGMAVLLGGSVCASAEPISASLVAAIVIPALRRKRRRSWLISSDF